MAMGSAPGFPARLEQESRPELLPRHTLFRCVRLASLWDRIGFVWPGNGFVWVRFGLVFGASAFVFNRLVASFWHF